ncbi:hypothetical protein CPB84DRAFT_1750994 [Gymnopilus junonius]|uniref:Uncharacterized protein n=1 Tax=Gymnopilus junonius TaxID=109634 RepID=A0A9P5NDM5_GYMJU|nr:hypothetical protein CPB84DRAFT_1750994 [Gymnopilus junonius]
MPRTRGSWSQSHATANGEQVPKAGVTMQPTQKTKHTHSHNAKPEGEPVAAKKPRMAITKSKCQCEADGPPSADLDQAAPTKKARKAPGTAATKPVSPTRQSAHSRTQTTAQRPTQKHKQYSPEQITADNAKQEAEK